MPGPRVRATDAVLRERIAEVLHAAGGRYETADADTITDALLPVVARYCEQLEAGRETWKTKAAEMVADRDLRELERNRIAFDLVDMKERAESAEADRDRLRSDLDLMRVQAKSLSDQLNGRGLRLSNSGLRELGEARTEVRRLHIELAESKVERDRLAAELETMTHVAKVNGEGHRAACQGGEEARQAVARVRALHRPLERAGETCCAHCSGWDGTRCLGLVTPWPCPTLAAFDGTGDA